ncbi:MAG: CPBP family intramembrane metalloprotease [Clostridia bacterium]|nr:CPBP family intramembrane metalloprotease [Clostridia bacterium]
MNKENRQKLKNIKRFKWSNPNHLNALTSIIAFLIAIIGFNLLSLLVSLCAKPLIKDGKGFYAVNLIAAVIGQVYLVTLACIICKIKKVKIFGGGNLQLSFDFLSCIPALLLGLGTFLCVTPIHMQFATYIEQLQQELFNASTLIELPEPNGTIDIISMFIYVFIVIPFVPAICEELLFRGVIMNGLREFGTIFAVLLSGLLFALMHGSYRQLILQFVLGCEIALVVIITENYFAGIIMHLFNNFFSIVYSVVIATVQSLSPAFLGFFQAFSIIIGLLLILASLIYYLLLIRHKKKDSGKSFLFYKKKTDIYPCCLLQKGAPVDYCFAVSKEKVLNTDNSNFLFFANGRFNAFTKRSNKVAFGILCAISLLLAIGLIILDFVLVG